MESQSSIGFDTSDFEKLYKYEESSFWFQARNKLIVRLLKKYFPHMHNFMEIGCGTGFVINGIRESIPNVELHGSELFEEGLVYARKRMPDVDLFQLNAKEFKATNAYDVIGIFDVLEHIDEDELVLKNIYDSLKENGGICITVPQHKFMWSETDVQACHERRYTQKELKDKLQRAGFNIAYISGFVSLLFPIMWMSRKAKKNESVELEINKALNSCMNLVMKIESLLMKCGLKFKFGGSIIAIGIKGIK